MPSSPVAEETNLISFSILSSGSEIPTSYEVLRIRVEKNINRIASAEITIRDGSAAKQTFEITESDTFKPGAEIEVKMGYQNQNDTVFKGLVVKQSVNVDDTSGSELQITCKDEAAKMTVNRKNAIFTETKDSDLIEKIAGDIGLSTDIKSTGPQHKKIIQYYSTDWDFIISRAEVNGLIVITDNGKLRAAQPAVSENPELKLQYGYDIMEFDGEIDATFQYSAVESNAWDISGQNVINASASEPTVNKQGNITGSTLSEALSAGSVKLISSVPVSQDDIQNWADAALLKSRLSRFKGTVTFQGSNKAKPNSTIQLSGMSKRFDGNAFVSGVTHLIEGGHWKTEARIGLSPEWFTESHRVTAPLASGLLPGVNGLQTGIVKKINADPDNEFRVQVEIPILGNEGKAVWARMSTFYTGKNIGAFFMPEVNDEVILGFMNDDPRFPVILGSVFSSSISAPETPDENNSIKTLVTSSKMQLKFDEENKVITVLTPGGNKLVLSDQDEGITLTDQNSNTIKMNSEGISLDSQSSLSIKAAESVKIQGASVSINGDESVSAGGGTVSLTGNESATLSGSGECTVSSDGQMSVKGLTVMIN